MTSPANFTAQFHIVGYFSSSRGDFRCAPSPEQGDVRFMMPFYKQQDEFFPISFALQPQSWRKAEDIVQPH